VQEVGLWVRFCDAAAACAHNMAHGCAAVLVSSTTSSTMCMTETHHQLPLTYKAPRTRSRQLSWLHTTWPHAPPW
jgi:hypothetical protein